MAGQSTPMFSIKYFRHLFADCYRSSLSCTAIQAESNELFGVIIKLMFAKKFRKFQRHSCRRFSRDVQLQRLRDGPRHLLVINLMRAAIRGGGCDGGHSWVCKSNAQNCKAAHPPTTQKSLASHRDHFTPRLHVAKIVIHFIRHRCKI